MSNVSARIARLSTQSALLATTAAVSAVGTAHAELIITNVDETATTDNVVQIDLNDDGFMDFTFVVKGAEQDINLRSLSSKETGFVTTRFRKAMKPLEKTALSVDTAIEEPTLKPGKRGIFSDKKISNAQPYATRFEEGDVISKASGPFTSKARLYDDFGAEGRNPEVDDDDVKAIARDLSIIDEENFGPFAEVGDSGYIGLFVDLVPLRDDDDDRFLALNVEEFEHMGEEEPSFFRFYGWAEIERGSLNVIRIGFQSNPFQGAPIPRSVDIPEPASLPLMALGAAGLIALRRRMAA